MQSILNFCIYFSTLKPLIPFRQVNELSVSAKGTRELKVALVAFCDWANVKWLKTA